MGDRDVVLLDCTLRDGSYVIDFQFSAQDTAAITGGLDRAGIKMIEVGHGLGLGASGPRCGVARESDAAYISAAKANASRAQIGAFFVVGIGTEAHLREARGLGLDFVRIGADVTRVREAAPLAATAKALGFDVSINMMKSYALSPAKLGPLAAEVARWGVDAVSVVDSAGCLLPSHVADYVRAVREHTECAVGFHGHNNLGLANANCLAALEAGARIVDASLRGMGRSAGNAQTEVLAHLLPASGFDCSVDPFALFDVAEKHVTPQLQHPRGPDPLEVVGGIARLHSSHLPRFEQTAETYGVDLRRLISEVSAIDCVNPSDALLAEKARYLAVNRAR